jgi:mono/diheme cytochrome c family protein
MTDRHDPRRARGGRVVLPLMASALLLACEAQVGIGPASPYQSDASSTDPRDAGWNNEPTNDGGTRSPNNPPNNINPPIRPANDGGTSNQPMNPEDAMCADAASAAKQTLEKHCGNCHGAVPNPQAGLAVLDVPKMLTTKKVVANQPDNSLIYKRLKDGSMPPTQVTERPDNEALTAIELWIDCGAPDFNAPAQRPAFVDIDKRMRWVLDDLRSFPNPIDRQRMRYLDISTLSNGGSSAEQLDTYRDSVAMLMNSLSRGRSVIAPTAVDQSKLLYRIDLRDYLWDDTTWDQLEAIYPYAVIYDRDSRLFPYDEVTAEQIRLETRTEIPIIQADWFLSHASRPPLYYSLLELPNTLQGLEQQLGVDIQENIDTEQVLRSGFAVAGPSRNNRMIERHELGGNRGALWLSYDFANNLGDKNIFANPLDFQEDGGEMIFNLDNGLQGYFIADAAGQRLDKAPNNVVQDPDSRDGAVESGLSCMNCHQVEGQLEKADEIREFQLSAGANANETEQVLALYVPAAELTAAFQADKNRYKSARAALGIKRMDNRTMHQLDNKYLGVVNIDGVAAALGLSTEQFKQSVDATPQAFPPEIVTLRKPGGAIPRDSFEAIYEDVVEGLGLGQQLLANSSEVQLPEPEPQAPAPEPEPQPEPADAGAAGAAGSSGSADGGGTRDGDGRRN